MAGNFQHMGAAGGNQMMMQQQHPPQQQPPNNALQQMLLQSIQGQTGPLTGWQANVPVSERLGQVWHIVSQLRLANNGQYDLQKICSMALQFEKGSFDSAPDRDTYLKILRDKLEQLTLARNQMSMSAQAQLQAQVQAQAQAHAAAQAQAQAQVQHLSMVNQGNMARPNMSQQSQPQQGFQHLQHQMQASPLPNQQQPQQLPMGMVNNPLGQNAGQPHQQFPMALPQQQQPQPQPQTQAQQPQVAPNNRPQGVQGQLTQQEQAMVQELTNRLMQSASDEDKNTIRLNLQTRMDQQTLQRYQQQGVDPLVLYYRNQAVNRLRQEKTRQAQMANQQQPQGMGVNVKRPPAAVSMQQQRSANQSNMGVQGQQPQQMGPNLDFGSFLGSVENVIGQQQTGLLQQDGSQIGVPANVAQGNVTPQSIGGIPGQNVTPNGQRPVPNQNMRMQQQPQPPQQQPQPQPQQQFNAQQSQQERMNQQAIQTQAQIRATNQAKAQQMALHGQPGGMGPMPPQQSPAMNTLNTPLRNPQQPGQMDQQQANQSGTPHFGQALDPRFVQLNQRASMNGGAANGPIFPPNMTAEQRQKLATLPPEKLNEVIGKWNERAAHPGQAGKPQPQPQPQVPMPGLQGPRPNQPGAQAAFNQQNMVNPMAAQMMAGAQAGQRPPQAMMAGMNPQQQMLLQQQMARMPQQPNQARNVQGALLPAAEQAVNQIDHMEFPPTILTNHPFLRQAPPEVKRWGQLKQWVSQNPNAQPGLLEQMKNYQRLHYQNLLRNRNAQLQQQRQQQAAAGGVQQPQQVIPPQTQAQPMAQPGMAAPVAPMGQPQMQNNGQQPINLAAMGPLPQVSLQDIQKARAHPSGKWAALSDDEIKNMILKNAIYQRQRQMQQQQQMQMAQIAQMGQQQQNVNVNANQRNNTPQVPQVPQVQQVQPQQQQNQNQKQMGRAAQPQAVQGRPQTQPTPADSTQPANASARGGKGNQARGAGQTTSPPQPQKNLKRSNSDDVVEVPNPNLQQNARSNQQQPAPQQVQQMQQPPQAPQNQQKAPQQGRPRPTAQQLAALPPEARKQYEQALRNQQMKAVQATPEDVKRCNAILQDETMKFEPLPDLPMSNEARASLANKLLNAAPKLLSVKKAVARWFAITHDEARLRLFFRTQHKISQQFLDENMTKTKQTFSIKPVDVDQAYILANTMIADVLAKYPNFAKSATGAGANSQNANNAPSGQQPPVQTAPLNAANLQQLQQQQKQNQGKATPNRGNNRANQTPVAPTTAQPPFHLGTSPHGTPIMYGKSEITQESLRLPPAKKQRQASSTSQAGQPTPSSTTAAQPNKAGSPDAKKQIGEMPPMEESQKLLPLALMCPEPDCDHFFSDPFENEEQLAKHREEEHIKPLGDPPKYVLGELATLLGLEADGSAKATGEISVNVNGVQPPAENATPMDRQTSAITKASPASLKASKSAKNDSTKDATTGGKVDSSAKSGSGSNEHVELAVTDKLWANSSINPQDLLHNFSKFETGAAGAISDMNVYRSITPNDTPESSKDGNSEPNSDITEGADLAINLDMFDEKWLPFGVGEADDLLDFSNMNVNGAEDMMMLDLDNSSTKLQSWDEFVDPSMFDKPFTFDTSLYSMNAE